MFARLSFPVGAVLLGALVVAAPVRAQVSGSISGYVRDQSGAIIPAVGVTARSAEQQLTRSTVTDNTGYYNLLAIPSGTYEITAAADGFDRQIQGGVRLTLGENLRLDVNLKVGSIQSEVTVSSTATLVNTSSQTLSGLVDDRRVQDLPSTEGTS